MIGHNVNLKLEGIIYAAFQLFCHNNGYQNSSDGVRALIRELPEFKMIQAAANGQAAMNSIIDQASNHEPSFDSSVQTQPTVG